MKKQGNGQAVLTSRDDGLARQLVSMAVWGALGLLIPRASIYGGMTPFGVGLAAAVSGPISVLTYLTILVGYFLPQGTPFPFRYVLAVATVAGLRWSLSGLKKVTSKAFFAPALAFMATLISGLMLTALQVLSTYTVLVVVAESLLAGGFAYFADVTYRMTGEGVALSSLTLREQVGVVGVSAVALMAVSVITLSGISPGRIVSLLLILLFARNGKEQSGSIAGVVLGTAMALTGFHPFYLTAAYAFGGLLAGIFSRYGRLASAGAFVVSNALVILGAEMELSALIQVYEAAAASLIFIALPRSVDQRIGKLFQTGETLPIVSGVRRCVGARLEGAATAMKEVAGTVDTVSKKLASFSAPDLGTMYRGEADPICRRCPKQMVCWEEQFDDTMDSFNDMTVFLRENGYIEPFQVTGHLARSCGFVNAIVQRINNGYREHLVREGAYRRLNDIRTVITEQFEGMSDILLDLSDELGTDQRLDTEAAARVSEVCRAEGLEVSSVVCSLNGNHRMSVEILADDEGVQWNERAWRQEIDAACGRTFDRPQVVRLLDGVSITLHEIPRLSVTVGAAQWQCRGERFCGDAYETFHDSSGRFLTVLSDGMGSGGRAAVDGAMAAGLTARLLRSGFRPDSVLRLVNTALMAKGGDESLATLDVVAINLYTGQLESLKAGAAVSLLCSKGRLSRIERSSLPVGILKDVSFERSTDTLVDGDILLLMSDGATANGVAWLEKALQEFDASSGDMKRLAEEIARTAKKRQADQYDDDITVVALQVHNRRSSVKSA